MKRISTVFLLVLVVMSQIVIWAPAVQAVPLSCQESPSDPDCIMDLMFEWAFSEWNEENGGSGVHGVGIF